MPTLSILPETMLHGHLSEIDTYSAFTAQPVWEAAFRWLHELDPNVANGTYEIAGPRMFAVVQSYETLNRDACRFESHEEQIDIQYTISGLEGIDWSPRSGLEPDGGFANDVQFWLAPKSEVTTLAQHPGHFAIFFPADAHRPKVRIKGANAVKKLVIKIHRELTDIKVQP